jgi:hypothetical protein
MLDCGSRCQACLSSRRIGGRGIWWPVQDSCAATGGGGMDDDIDRTDLDRALRRMSVLHERELAASRRARAAGTTHGSNRAARLVVLRQVARRPNTAVPTRTIVAPSATAASRSRLIPIDSSPAPAVPGEPDASTSSRTWRRSA